MPHCSLPFPTSSSPNLPSPSLPYGPNPPLGVKFRVSHRENLRYLKTLRVIAPDTKPHRAPPPEALDALLQKVDFFKSKGFPDSAFHRLASSCPHLFRPDSNLHALESLSPIFDFLASEVPATGEECCGLISCCPEILLSNVDYIMRPTLQYLKQLGVRGLNSPTNLNAHLLNTRVNKLKDKVRFLRSVGFSYEEATEACARFPAIFGYSIDSNLRPKYEYLVREMERDVSELKRFPQYFAFSLEKRIRPRHLHLHQRNVQIPLNRMLMWNDTKFYKRWK